MNARDDYPITEVWSRDKLGRVIDMHYAMCDEIDRLRALVLDELSREAQRIGMDQ